MKRSIFASGTTGVVMRRPRMPAWTITSASPSLAQATPRAPAAICRRAISGHRWVFACGRMFFPAARTCAAMRARLRSKRSRSRSRAGVGISSRRMGGHSTICCGFTAAPPSGPSALDADAVAQLVGVVRPARKVSGQRPTQLADRVDQGGAGLSAPQPLHHEVADGGPVVVADDRVNALVAHDGHPVILNRQIDEHAVAKRRAVHLELQEHGAGALQNVGLPRPAGPVQAPLEMHANLRRRRSLRRPDGVRNGLEVAFGKQSMSPARMAGHYQSPLAPPPPKLPPPGENPPPPEEKSPPPRSPRPQPPPPTMIGGITIGPHLPREYPYAADARRRLPRIAPRAITAMTTTTNSNAIWDAPMGARFGRARASTGVASTRAKMALTAASRPAAYRPSRKAGAIVSRMIGPATASGIAPSRP